MKKGFDVYSRFSIKEIEKVCGLLNAFVSVSKDILDESLKKEQYPKFKKMVLIELPEHRVKDVLQFIYHWFSNLGYLTKQQEEE